MYLATTLLPAKCSSPQVHCRDGRLHLLNIFVCCLVHFHNNNLHPSISFHVEGLQTITQTDPLLRCSHLQGERRKLSGSRQRPPRRGLLSTVPSGWGAEGLLGSPRLQRTPPYATSVYLGMEKPGAGGSPSCLRCGGEPAKGAVLLARSALAAGAALGLGAGEIQSIDSPYFPCCV